MPADRIAPGSPENSPLVSVVMSNFNGAGYLDAALASVLGQSHRNLELIVADDASEDNSLAILKRVAAEDNRLKIIAKETNTGPAGARNAALEAAQGTWIAIVDADDLIHPQRIARLLAAAEALDAQVIADDLISFGAGQTAGHTLLEGRQLDAPLRLTTAEFIRSDTVASGLSSFGYLKPMIRRDALGTLRYDETLQIGEDFDLYARLLIGGARFLVLPAPLYFYRRHSGSSSHRLSVPVLQRLLQAHDAVVCRGTRNDPNNDLQAAFMARRAALRRALQHQYLVEAIKAQKGMEAARRLIRDPVLLVDLAASLTDRLRRRPRHKTGDQGAAAQTLVMATPDRIDQVIAPPDAIRMPVTLSPAQPHEDWSAQRDLARGLARLACGVPPDVIAEGAAGLEGLGYLPAWRSARLTLDPATARDAIVPPDVTVELSADRG